jgi:hypothetical protein
MSNTITSQVIGTLTQDKTFPDWWASGEIAIPFFDGEKLTVTFTDFMPDDDEHFVREADAALISFLSLGREDRLALSNSIYKNCNEVVEVTDDEYIPEEIRAIKDETQVWDYVHPTEIYVTRRPKNDQDIYIQIACECDWEEEHGLQLVFRQGQKLTRVSSQDGQITEADAYGRPDEEDELLSLF